MLAFALQRGGWWCPMCGSDGLWGGTMMGFMMLFWLLVIVWVGWLIYRASAGGWSRGAAPPVETPEDILKARYARGEVDKELYERMLADLRETSSTQSHGTAH
jgi:putative membrane protein